MELMFTIAGGIVLAFLFIRWFVRNEERIAQQKKREERLDHLITEFLSRPKRHDTLRPNIQRFVEQFATWLTTEKGAAALSSTSYQLDAAVSDFKTWAKSQYGWMRTRAIVMTICLVIAIGAIASLFHR
jgi:DNA alkylation repair enzyme